METKWILPKEVDKELYQKLTKQLNIAPVIAQILINRGYDTVEKAKSFLKPSISDLYDPFLMPGMDMAVQRIRTALKNKEHIFIHGDYDVDGLTASALLYWVLIGLGANVSYYIPNRLTEGYGLSDTGVREAKNRGAKLIISVDCGITASKEVEIAKSLGIDVIITDHHEPEEIIPSAYSILNPKLEPDLFTPYKNKSPYPFKELSGVGVAFKLVQAIYKDVELPIEDLEEHLDLVSLGTAADIVPLVGENRIFVKHGFQKISQTSKPGLQALLNETNLGIRDLTTGHIVFVLAPRINAVGRLGDPERALKLLTTNNQQQAINIAKILNAENSRRKEIDNETYEEAKKMVKETVDLESHKVIVLASQKWHRGVIGIVASRLVEEFYRPSVLISIDEQGEGHGSARSIPSFHLHNALKKCSEHLIAFGGHKYAAGLSLNINKIDDFREALNQIACKELTADDLIPTLQIDGIISLDEINTKLVNQLSMFAPYGPNNMHPVLKAISLELVGYPRVVGKDGNHLKLKVKQKTKVLDAIGFNLGSKLQDILSANADIDMAFVLEYNEHMGVQTIQGRIKDIKVCNGNS